MQIYVLAVGDKPPSWIEAGVNQYIERMPRECNVQINTIATAKRSKSQAIKQAQEQEQELLLKHTPNDSLRIALGEHGKSWTTLVLAERLENWLQNFPVVTLYIGGPDGFTQDFLDQADFVWSLSTLTMPHMLVRVLLVEQLYRAWTIIQGHPYHRE